MSQSNSKTFNFRRKIPLHIMNLRFQFRMLPLLTLDIFTQSVSRYVVIPRTPKTFDHNFNISWRFEVEYPVLAHSTEAFQIFIILALCILISVWLSSWQEWAMEKAHLLCNITKTSLLQQQYSKLLKVISNVPPKNQTPNRLPRDYIKLENNSNNSYS